MSGEIYYGRAEVLGTGSSDSVGSSEIDIIEVNDPQYLVYSQLSIHTTVTLGSNTQIDVRIYYRDEIGGAWHLVPKVNDSTGVVEDDYYRFNSSSPSPVTLDLPISAAFELKATAEGDNASNDGDVTISLLSRSN